MAISLGSHLMQLVLVLLHLLLLHGFVTADYRESRQPSFEACEGSLVVFTNILGFIQSPPFPEGNGEISNCTWVIQGRSEEIVSIRFGRFRIPCISDSLIIQVEGQQAFKLCGYEPPKSMYLPGGNVTIIYSTQRGPGLGFQLSFTKDLILCLTEEFQCWNHKCIPAIRRCNGVDDCGDLSDEESCGSAVAPKPPQCNLTLGDFYSVFSTPGYLSYPYRTPGPYQCRWVLDPHDSQRLVLSFSALELGPSDAVSVYDGLLEDTGHLLRNLDSKSNGKQVIVESSGSKMLVTYLAGSPNPGRGFNATYRVRGYCLPWDHPCGAPGAAGEAGCFSDAQRCDGLWDCDDGKDEAFCPACYNSEVVEHTVPPPPPHFPCGGRGGACYALADRCNYQTFCADGSDERRCASCQPGNFHCDNDRCIYETWVCDGQADCLDGSDERHCAYTLPRKVVTAAVIGSLICGLLLVIALGCTCKLYAIRTRDYSIFAPLSSMDAEIIQQQAPPSYGQLIAQGVIPPVDDFPTENPNDNSVLGNIRAFLQILRQDQSQAAPSRRRRRGRHARRVLRRLRRWGLLPRSTVTSAFSSTESTPGQPPMPPTTETSGTEHDAATHNGVTVLTENENTSQAPPLPTKLPPVPLDTQDPLPVHEPAMPQGAGLPTIVAFSSFSTTLSDVVQSLRGRLFSQPSRRSTGDPEILLPAHPIPPADDDDDVLLLPLAEACALSPQQVAAEQMHPDIQPWAFPPRSEVHNSSDDDDVQLLPC
ncbi:low-density lipoprotein receptor-related protein 10 [Ambystoma mexicanum]|uniref:low-density lipoprotein receptor-related protein 10 n=1 Tax=Ambystoma mexicanum TaxID=8296 RepID=UPI0037E8DF68